MNSPRDRLTSQRRRVLAEENTMERTDIPEKFRKLYERAMKGRSQSAAIRSFCLECVGYVQDEVHECTDKGCPLYLYRVTGRKVPLPPDAAKRPAQRPFTSKTARVNG